MDRALVPLARWWSWRRQRLDRSCRGVEDCLHSVIGVCSSNPQGPLSLLARVPRLMRGAAVEGVISTKRAVRIPAMRRSIFMVPTERADVIYSATRLPEDVYRQILKRAGVGDKRYADLKRDILLAAGFPKSTDEIRDAIASPPNDLGPVLRYLCAQGDLLRIKSSSIRSNVMTYAATRVWLGRDLKLLDQYASVEWLAGAYLTAFGPASVDDFAWWTGLPAARASEALDTIQTVDVGEGLLLHARDERPFFQTRPHTGRVNLLPKSDCYTMGYAQDSRARFVHPSLLERVYDRSGDGQPMVLVEGEVQGTWSIRFTKAKAALTLSMFDRPGAKLRAALEDEAMMVGTFLDAHDVVVTLEKVPKRAPAKR